MDLGRDHHRHSLAVVGRGPVFEHRFGPALEVAGLLVVDLTLAARSRIEIIVASTLDGWQPDDGIPEEADGLPWVLLADKVDELDGQGQDVICLSPQVSPEDLVFVLCDTLAGDADRRHGGRMVTQMLVRYKVVDRGKDTVVVSGELANLGLDGTFVRSLKPPPLQSEVVLEIVAGDGPEPLLLSGRVVHIIEFDLEAGIVCSSQGPGRPVPSHPGFALAFEPAPTEEIRRRLQRLIVDSGLSSVS